MDTKLKNNLKTKIKIAAVVLLILAIVTVAFFPAINQKTRSILAEQEGIEIEEPEINKNILEALYQGSYVLYYETMQRQGAQTAADIYLKVEDNNHSNDNEKMLTAQINDALLMEADEFESFRSDIDYCIPMEENTYEKNTTQELERVITDVRHDNLSAYYSDYFVLKFDSNGILSIDSVYSENGIEDTIVKTFGQIARESLIWGGLEYEYTDYGMVYELKKPTDFTVIYGIPKTAENQIAWNAAEYMEGVNAEYWEVMHASAEAGAVALYTVMLALIAALVWLMTSRKIWKTEISMERPGKWYLMEAATCGVIWVVSLQNPFVRMTWSYDYLASYDRLFGLLGSGAGIYYVADIFSVILAVFVMFVGWYLSLRFIRPVFTLGLREYIHQYSLIYQIYPWMKKKWDAFKNEVVHLDFSEKSTKTIVKIVVLNFVILAICSMMWFFGIFALIIYSVVLFLIIKKYYDKAGRNYQTLLRGVGRIAEGDLDSPIIEDIGMFEPFKAELSKIQTGFKKAVDEEVKSQRMKTELITNVSHDLKTPLTAITTYVELLKKEDITEEERRSYIETLEKKSQRLKVLIEDLFEVSKATSNNITLNPVEMDVINLLKQVSIEHKDKFEQLNLDLRWNVPEEKVIRTLDPQKTYRVFENLFGNVQKYAMPGSRVYVDVELCETNDNSAKRADELENGMHESHVHYQENGRRSGNVQIVMKNMSAQELNVKAEEITERFVRGDSSRNTEGSGLGLAIAKSFTEAQGGKFNVEVDGDLFKVVIVF